MQVQKMGLLVSHQKDAQDNVTFFQIKILCLSSYNYITLLIIQMYYTLLKLQSCFLPPALYVQCMTSLSNKVNKTKMVYIALTPGPFKKSWSTYRDCPGSIVHRSRLGVLGSLRGLPRTPGLLVDYRYTTLTQSVCSHLNMQKINK